MPRFLVRAMLEITADSAAAAQVIVQTNLDRTIFFAGASGKVGGATPLDRPSDPGAIGCDEPSLTPTEAIEQGGANARAVLKAPHPVERRSVRATPSDRSRTPSPYPVARAGESVVDYIERASKVTPQRAGETIGQYARRLQGLPLSTG